MIFTLRGPGTLPEDAIQIGMMSQMFFTSIGMQLMKPARK